MSTRPTLYMYEKFMLLQYNNYNYNYYYYYYYYLFLFIYLFFFFALRSFLADMNVCKSCEIHPWLVSLHQNKHSTELFRYKLFLQATLPYIHSSLY